MKWKIPGKQAVHRRSGEPSGRLQSTSAAQGKPGGEAVGRDPGQALTTPNSEVNAGFSIPWVSHDPLRGRQGPPARAGGIRAQFSSRTFMLAPAVITCLVSQGKASPWEEVGKQKEGTLASAPQPLPWDLAKEGRPGSPEVAGGLRRGLEGGFHKDIEARTVGTAWLRKVADLCLNPSIPA